MLGAYLNFPIEARDSYAGIDAYRQISGVGNLPLNAEEYKGKYWNAPRWPLVGSLPSTVVNGQRLRIAEVGQQYGREYLGRSVVEISSGWMVVPNVTTNISTTDWRIELSIRDVIPTATTQYAGIFKMFTDPGVGAWCLALEVTEENELWLWIRNPLVGNFASAIIKSLMDSDFFTVSLEKTGNVLFWNAGDKSGEIDLTGFSCPDLVLEHIAPDDGVRPLQVSSVKQYFNNALLDNIPCTETTGTVLANTANPLRPATLSSADAHALAWVPQPSVTMGVWRSKKCARFNGTSSVISNFAFTSLVQSGNYDLEIRLIDDTETDWEGMLSNRASPYEGMLVLMRRSDKHPAIEGYGFTATLAPYSFLVGSVKIRVAKVGNSATWYVDDVVVYSGPTSVASSIASSGIYLGSAGSAGTDYDGLISSVKIVTDTQSMMWDMEDISGSTVPDRTGNGYSGTLTNIITEYAWVLQ